MKNIVKNIALGLTCLGFAALTACVNPPSEDKLFLTEDQANQVISDNGGKLLNLDDFKNQFVTKYGVFFPVRERSYTYSGGYQMDTTDYTKNNLGWFSIDTIPTYGQQYYIRGRVITDDAGGNFYKSIVIQQMVNGEQQVLRISVDASNLGGQLLVGQEIMIHVNGLSIGKYSNQIQLCVPSYNDNIYAQYASQKTGWAPGRIPAPRFMEAVTLIGKPDVSELHYDVMTISQIISIANGTDDASNALYAKYDGRLVRVEGVHFTGQYDNQGTPSACDLKQDPNEYINPNNAITFAPSTAGLGFPQGRLFTDASSQLLLVSNSEYSKFASYYLPGAGYDVNNCADYVGNISGILGHYTDNGRNAPDQYDWSITLRDFSTPSHQATVEDIVMSNTTTGLPWVPQEYKKQ